jgi:hypothetical protein
LPVGVNGAPNAGVIPGRIDHLQQLPLTHAASRPSRFMLVHTPSLGTALRSPQHLVTRSTHRSQQMFLDLFAPKELEAIDSTIC